MNYMVLLTVAKLATLYNPLANPPWEELQGQTITSNEIKNWIDENKMTRPKKRYQAKNPETKEQHINRIAWYVSKGWGQSTITLSFHNNHWPIHDGNHRLAAAIYRNEEFIAANWEGSRDKLREVL